MSPRLTRTVFLWSVVAASGCAAWFKAPEDVGPPVGAPAQIFAVGIVSTGDVFASTFTPDGRTVVFTKFAPPRPMTLMSSSFVDGGWTPPATLPFSGTYRDLDPAFSPDGRRLYFSSARPTGPSPADTTNGVDTWYVFPTSDGWSAPRHLAPPVNGPETDMYPSVTNRGVLYFDSFRSVPRRRLVYRAEPRPDGTLGPPEALPQVVNADSGASNLFVDPDERYVVFSAVRPEGKGSGDLYVSFRRDGAWTTPRNIGPQVNTGATEFCPFVSRDGKYLYFTRITPTGTQGVVRNIYRVRVDDLLDRLAKGEQT
jgi:hypothetical protein